jgi:hypothetical protein
LEEWALVCIHHIHRTRYLNNDWRNSFVFRRLDDEVDDSLAIPTLKPLVYLYIACAGKRCDGDWTVGSEILIIFACRTVS